ncbi:MAG: MerC domain-containing protein [Bacteroidia bacterium]|nr:MerC domain-containing protein [Bacteroidia bacterium]
MVQSNLTSTNKRNITVLGFFSSALDTIGLSASGLCAIHCALVPLILTFTPLLSLGFFDSPLFEWIMIGSSVTLALTSFINGYYKHHHSDEPLSIMLIAFIFFTLGHPRDIETLVTPICMTFGGIIMAYAHYRNWKLCKEKNFKVCN